MTPETSLSEAFRLTETQKSALTRLGLLSVRDLLFHFPSRYVASLSEGTLGDLQEGEHVVLYGKVSKLEATKGFRSKIPMAKAVFEDASGIKINLIWFHQPYIAKMLRDGERLYVTGKLTRDSRGLGMANPHTSKSGVFEKKDKNGPLFEDNHKNTESYTPLYPESRGITSRWFYYTLQKIFAAHVHEKLEDPLPSALLKKYNLPSLSSALVWLHAPRRQSDAQAARKRFAFEEIFFIQLERQKARGDYQKNDAFSISPAKKDVEEFIQRFPFTLTNAQESAVHTILNDFKKGIPMSRLLEGDVGSGKTAVAAITSYAVVMSRPQKEDGAGAQTFGNLQTAIMAPTEILARQHFEDFVQYFEHLPIQVGLITGSGCRKFPSKVNPKESTPISRAQLLKWVANGEIPILIGTHALIQKSVSFKHLAYTIIDEQHRFGTRQRAELSKKEGYAPHLLSMSATPIPRTLALTIYGDLDLTLLDEMPKGRKPVITEAVFGSGKEKVYERAHEELAAGRQLYVICPRIEEPDGAKERVLQMKSTKEEAVRLKKEEFPNARIEILHSKIKPKEKEEIMQRMLGGEIDILVATSVVEVGVNIPNATTIIIEGAERFGLAQLHQLRGRVLRSTHQSYCFLLSESKSKETKERIKTLVSAKNGFELAEKDLLLRGAGELSGKRQWGISDVGMEAIRNIKMVEAAREEAQTMLHKDPELKKFPLIARRVETLKERTYFE
ncbi:MAG: ATP-dependent DNA helicase RecG [Candidatus Paceibacterota bacterium]